MLPPINKPAVGSIITADKSVKPNKYIQAMNSNVRESSAMISRSIISEKQAMLGSKNYANKNLSLNDQLSHQMSSASLVQRSVDDDYSLSN